MRRLIGLGGVGVGIEDSWLCFSSKGFGVSGREMVDGVDIWIFTP